MGHGSTAIVRFEKRNKRYRIRHKKRKDRMTVCITTDFHRQGKNFPLALFVLVLKFMLKKGHGVKDT